MLHPMLQMNPASEMWAARVNSRSQTLVRSPAYSSCWKIKFLTAACFLLAALLHTPVMAAQNPEQFVDSLAKDALAVLRDPKINEPQRLQQFRSLLSSNVDMPRIGRFVLGAHWRRADPDQQAEYQTLFSEYVIASYAGRLKEYTDSVVTVKKATPNGESEFVVTSMVAQPGNPQPVRVDWRLREADGELRIVDLMIEGISMALSQRSEFAALIQTNGGDISVLLTRLRDVARTIQTAGAPVSLTH